MLPRSLSRCRRGYVLVYFAMLSFVLMSVAALVIDVGFAFVTRRQMQTAVGSAALEGLRFRDSIPPQWKDPTNPGQLDSSIITAMQGEGLDPSNLDNVRRWAAQQNVVNTFDDNLNPADGDPSNAFPYQGGPANFGAGPVVHFTESPGVPPSGQAIAASQTISPGTPTVYKPSDLKWPFQINPNNDVMGDMVSGSYTFNPLNYAPSMSLVEDENYNRTDFQAGTTSPANSFLVRMKRSNEPPNNAPISSSGPPIPYLFGRGSLLTTQQRGGDTVWAKSQGITVRATSIADVRPVMMVGRQSTVNQTQIPGVTSFGLRYKFWIQFGPTKSSPQLLVPGGVLTTQPIELDPAAGNNSGLTAQSQSVGPGRDGQYLSWPDGKLPSIGWRVSTISLSQPAFSNSINTINYVPIYDSNFVGDGADWIVGFGLVQVVSSSPLQIKILNGEIAPMNALASVLGDAFDPSITAAALTSLISANQGLRLDPNAISATQQIPPVLLAPALVRSE